MIEAFVEAGLLAQAKRDDPAAIEAAIARLCREGYRSVMSAQANVKPSCSTDDGGSRDSSWRSVFVAYTRMAWAC